MFVIKKPFLAPNLSRYPPIKIEPTIYKELKNDYNLAYSTNPYSYELSFVSLSIKNGSIGRYN
jgi:hypothetical protein